MRDLDPKKIARGIVKAEQLEESIKVVFWEFFVLSAIVGVYYRSFVIFLLTFIGLRICLYLPIVGRIISIILSIVWGIISGVVVWSMTQNVKYAAIAGIIAFLGSIGMHASVRD